MKLGAGENRTVEIGYESLAGDPVFGAAFERAFDQDVPPSANSLALTSLLAPAGRPGDAASIVFGANLSMRTGLKTAIGEVNLFGEMVRGSVVGDRDSGPQPLTAGSVNVVAWTAGRPKETHLTSATVDLNGRFDAPTPPAIIDAFGHDDILVEAFYLGSWPWTPCRSGVRRIG